VPSRTQQASNLASEGLGQSSSPFLTLLRVFWCPRQALRDAQIATVPEARMGSQKASPSLFWVLRILRNNGSWIFECGIHDSSED
jgi:hypothetical protein